ncbi:MAG: hypothetical protein E7598_01780 [Ruminococcaceae bacterium]|nr:hypothetical protein [Oscillospiraceae bacterium]
MNKKLLSLLVVLTLAAIMAVSAFAADGLLDAVAALNGAGGTVTLTEDVTVADGTVIPEQAGALTITSENGAKLILDGSLMFEKNTNDNVITLDLPVEATEGVIYGGFNSVTFTNKFAVTGTLDFYGGYHNFESTSGETTATPEKYYAENKILVCELPYDIVVDGGTFRHFMGGSYRLGYSSLLGSIAAPITITINGGTFGSTVSYDADTALKVDKAFSISGMSILADDAILTINGGTFNTPIYAQGYIGQTSTRTSACSQYTKSDSKFYAIDGEIAININGGKLNGFEVGATQITAAYQQLVRGDYTVTVAEAADLADGIILDATQVKGYTDGSATATLTYPTAKNVDYVRFDSVNGAAQKYDEPTRIACIGDSITQGSRAVINKVENFELGSYPAQLYKKMFDLGEDVVVANYGCGATKVMQYSGLGYTEGLAYTLSMEETDPDIVIIGLGTNDANSTTYTYGMGDRYAEEYEAFVLGYEELDSTEMVYGTSAIYRKSTDVAAVANIRGIQDVVLNALDAAGKDVTYIDLYALTLDEALAGELLSGDNLHPHVAGYAIYADAIYDAIRNGITVPENFGQMDIYVAPEAPEEPVAGVVYGTNNAECTLENPTSNLAIAFAKAVDGSTIHIIGEYKYEKIGDAQYGMPTPVNVKNLTIKGYGEGASLHTNAKHFHIKNDATFDNIGIYTTSTGAIHIACGYNNVTFTETFKSKAALLAAGVISFSEDKASGWYNSRESVGSDEDCTITVNGGDFSYFMGGNYLYNGNYSKAIYGTYSGNMVINVGPNVVIRDNIRNGACGQNYLTGTITLNLKTWPEGKPVREFSWLGGSLESAKYDILKNTGSITVNLAEGLTNEVIKVEDLNVDGVVDIGDALVSLSYLLNGTPTDLYNAYLPAFYGMRDVDILHVLQMFKKLVF